MPDKMTNNFDICIVGGGPVGLVIGLSLEAEAGLKIAIIDKKFTVEHSLYAPAWALSGSSCKALEKLDIDFAQLSAPIKEVKVDNTITPDSAISMEMGDCPPRNANSHSLRQALIEKALSNKNIHLIEENVGSLDQTGASVNLHTPTQTITAKLLVGADGSNSFVRDQLDIPVNTTDTKQIALTTILNHHHNEGAAYEFFLPSGPLATIPYPGEGLSTLVWSLNKNEAERYLSFTQAQQENILSGLLKDILGEVRFKAPLFPVPLSLKAAERQVGERWALIGDAAQNIHPVAGQGLNLGIRDAITLAETINEAAALGMPYWAETTLDTYAKKRKNDKAYLRFSTDGLISLFHKAPFLQRSILKLGMRVVDSDIFLVKSNLMAPAHDGLT